MPNTVLSSKLCLHTFKSKIYLEQNMDCCKEIINYIFKFITV